MRGWLVFGIVFGACSPSHPPCSAAADCAPNTVCSAGACRPAAPAPIPLGTERAVLLPRKVAALYANRDARTWPQAVVFGSPALGDATLYLDFPAWPSQPVERALLILEPIEPSAATSEVVRARALRVRRSWELDELDATRPPLGLPAAAAEAPASTAHALALDVTALARDWEKRPHHNHGLALTASTSGGTGITSAARGARGPRLELYLR
jgi:hypothetical protein